eukprot:scaffold6919_cov92-Isochrysis_galbana.AAC.2
MEPSSHPCRSHPAQERLGAQFTPVPFTPCIGAPWSFGCGNRRRPSTKTKHPIPWGGSVLAPIPGGGSALPAVPPGGTFGAAIPEGRTPRRAPSRGAGSTSGRCPPAIHSKRTPCLRWLNWDARAGLATWWGVGGAAVVAAMAAAGVATAAAAVLSETVAGEKAVLDPIPKVCPAAPPSQRAPSPAKPTAISGSSSAASIPGSRISSTPCTHSSHSAP